MNRTRTIPSPPPIEQMSESGTHRASAEKLTPAERSIGATGLHRFDELEEMSPAELLLFVLSASNPHGQLDALADELGILTTAISDGQGEITLGSGELYQALTSVERRMRVIGELSRRARAAEGGAR